MRRIINTIALLLVAAVVSSCASKKEVEKTGPAEEDELNITKEASIQEGPVYTYDNARSIDQLPEAYLTFSGEPVELPGQGFVKLKGIILGKEPMVLIDIGGRSVIARVGDNFGGYEVNGVGEGHMKLVKTSVSNSDVGTRVHPCPLMADSHKGRPYINERRSK